MLLMKAKNVEVTIADRSFFKMDEISVYEGERVGLIGKNGQGKSLLLKYLLGKLSVVPQVEWFGTKNYFEQIQINHFENTSYLSGGEETIKRLNKCFALKSDILFLDEPSNNLDWKRIEELETRILHWIGAVVIASHDRALLNKVCTKIWELDEGEFTEYQGNYDDYVREKERQRQEHDAKYIAYTKEKKRLTERYQKKVQQSQNMDTPPSRFGNSEWQLYKGKAAGKRGKIERVSTVLKERIERMDKVEKPFEWDDVKMDYILQSPVYRKNFISVKDLSKEINGRRLYNVDSLKLKTGSKTACLGRNGCGKTTLIQQLLQVEHEGVDMTKNAKVGYFDQQLKKLPLHKTVLEYVMEGSTLPQHVIRIILARLRFFEEDMAKSINVLSGGEQVKISIAKLLVGDYNLLVLDEPTNHVDLDTLQALEGLLVDYPGTVLVVSHDREFVDRVANQLWIIEEETIRMFDGSLTEFESSKARPKQRNHSEEEKMMLETKLTEIISRLSIQDSNMNKEDLEREYDIVLKKLNELRKV